jgi:hypothetical protein
VSNAVGTNEIDIQRQVRAMLLDCAAGQDTDFAEIDGVVDLRPGQFFVAVFGFGSIAHDGDFSQG